MVNSKRKRILLFKKMVIIIILMLIKKNIYFIAPVSIILKSFTNYGTGKGKIRQIGYKKFIPKNVYCLYKERPNLFYQEVLLSVSEFDDLVNILPDFVTNTHQIDFNNKILLYFIYIKLFSRIFQYIK